MGLLAISISVAKIESTLKSVVCPVNFVESTSALVTEEISKLAVEVSSLPSKSNPNGVAVVVGCISDSVQASVRAIG